MLDRIILMTGEVEAPHLAGLLHRHAPEIRIDWIPDRPAFDQAVDGDLSGTRLIAVMTDIIVPASVLSALPGPAYNFHPGPPAFPGSCVAGFAIYEGMSSFGVTLHEMAPDVDTGPIIEVRRFDIDPAGKFQAVEMRAFETVIQQFADWAERLATDPAPLPRSDIQWSGPLRLKAEAERLKEITSDLSEEEIVRRYRAFG